MYDGEENMKKIKVVTSNNRGFLLNLFNYKNDKYFFEYSSKTIYEVNNNLKKILSKIVKMRVFDYIGLFQVIKCNHGDENLCFSYNRFLNSDKPYVILLENPAALVNYCWKRPRSFISKMKLKRLFENDNLKAIVCMSDACKKGLYQLYDIPKSLNVKQIYPMIFDSNCKPEDIRKKCYNKVLECLYISSDFYLKGGKDILNIYNHLDRDLSIHITIISKSELISDNDMEILKSNNIFSFVEFNLSKEELDVYYKNSAILLNPTRGDSFSLVTLEALKYGCVIIGADVYAIKEMVENDTNGYLRFPQYRYWSDKNMPNEKLMKENDVRKYEDREMTEMLVMHMADLCRNREKLFCMCSESLKKSTGRLFGEEYIAKKWISLFDQCTEIGCGE